jgi:serine/threonine-protein kinase
VKLADFGVARRINLDETMPVVEGRRVRPVLATPEYVAPEVVAGGLPAPSTDVYALGIVLFELICGRSPFRGGPASEVLRRHAECVPVPPPGLPAVVWPLIESCLAQSSADRPDPATLAKRFRRVESLLDGLAPLPGLGSEEVTWWARNASAVGTAASPVTWVPLFPRPRPGEAGDVRGGSAAPVSPAATASGLMVAVPTGRPIRPGASGAAPRPEQLGSSGLTPEFLPASGPEPATEPAPMSSTPVSPWPKRRGGKGTRALAGTGAAAVLLAVIGAGAVARGGLGGGTSDADRRSTIPPAVFVTPSPESSGTPAGRGPAVPDVPDAPDGGAGASGGPVPAPEWTYVPPSGVPGIGDPMPPVDR